MENEDVGVPAEPDLIVRDASYRAPGYRSFEFVSLEAKAPCVLAVLSGSHAEVRDLLLAVAGLVSPSRGSISIAGAPVRASRSFFAPARAGLGIVAGVSEPAGGTVEAIVRRELTGTASRTQGVDALGFLAEFSLATHADRGVEALEPSARFMLSAALACARGNRVVCIDASDRWCAGALSADLALSLDRLRAVARSRGLCMLIGTTDPVVARAADRAVPLDIDSVRVFAGER